MPAVPSSLLPWIAAVGIPASIAAGYYAGKAGENRKETEIDNMRIQADSGLPVPGGSKAREAGAKTAAATAAEVAVFSRQREWLKRIEKAEADELPALFKEIMDISDQYQRRAPREILLQKWVRLDAAGCLEYLEKNESGIRSHALAAWARHDAGAAYAWTQTAGDAGKVNELTRMLLEQLASVDPKKFLALAASAKEEQLPGEAIQTAFRKFAKSDPAGAVEALKSLGDKARNNGSWGLGVEWARTNPGAAFEWAKGITNSVERQSALRGVLGSWARTDPESAIAQLGLLEKVQDAKGQDPKYAIVQGLAAKDPRKALDFISENITNEQERMGLVGGQVISKLAGTMKPAELAALLDKAKIVKETGGPAFIEYEDGRIYRNQGFDLNMTMVSGGSVFQDLADPGASFRELTAGTMSAAGKFTAAAVAGQWVEKNPAGALAAYETTASGPSKDMLNMALLSRAAGENDLGLLAKIEGGLSKDARGNADDTIRNIARTDPAKALAWADQLPPESKSVSVARTAALGAWASYDTGNALAYADQRPAADQPELYNAISRSWANSDSYGNSEWVASLPEGPNRDQAAAGLIPQLAAREPQSAMAWTRSIQDPAVQEASYTSLFQTWSRRDKAAALQALHAETLPPETKTKIEAAMKTRSPF